MSPACPPIRGGTLSKGSFFENAGAAFDGKAEQLVRACEELKGRKLKKGDAAYELDMFSFLPIALHFWNSDEDFPASLQIFVIRIFLTLCIMKRSCSRSPISSTF